LIKIADLYKLKDLIDRLQQAKVLELQDAALNLEFEVLTEQNK
jgi:hypothetical protein